MRVLGIPHDIRRKVIGGGKEGNKPKPGGVRIGKKEARRTRIFSRAETFVYFD
jgi:hypothetical protein